jgi:NADH-dependent peroxiredoxin subunit C
MIKINQKAPDFSENGYVDKKIKTINLENYKGKWLVLFFYPADFTFVCPTELRELAKHHDDFKKLNAEIVSVSTDTVYAHKAWHDTSPAIGEIEFAMLADPAMRVCKAYETLIEEEGVSLRATFLIDPDGIIKAYEFHNNDIGRSVNELLRKIEAAKFTREHNGEVCPMNWHPGEKTLKPDVEMVGKI